MSKITKRELDSMLAFRVSGGDKEKLSAICQKLDLQESEVARRCLRLGMSSFTGVKLPGAQVDRAGDQVI